jgi:glutamate racemase
VILACNTASAKALRTIQQNDLQKINPSRRVLGVIRPTTEIIGRYTKTGNVGILATNGTVISNSYPIEIEKFYPGVNVFQEACPMWVPLVENNEYNGPGADYFIQKNINNLLHQCSSIDTILLACTHYPLLLDKIKKATPVNITVLSQGEIVAASLAEYLQKHPEMDEKCSKNGQNAFFTTDSTEDFDNHAGIFYGKPVKSQHLSL